MICCIKGCEAEVSVLSMCRRHYSALQNYGDPTLRKRTLVEFNGRQRTKKDWASDIGICAQTLGERLKRGWPLELALTTPKVKHSPRVKTPKSTPHHQPRV